MAGEDLSEGARFLVTFTKTRGVSGDDVAPLDVSLTTVDDVPCFTWKLLKESTEDRLLKLAQDTDGSLTQRDAAEELGLSVAAINKAKKRLQKANKLKPGREIAVEDAVGVEG